MHAGSRFSVAVHTLSLIGLGKGQAVTSVWIAASVNTNEVVIRRVLGTLKQAGLVRSRSGIGGGWVLERPLDSITLDQVYDAVEPGMPLGTHRDTNPACVVGRNIQGAMDALNLDVRQAVQGVLSGTTVADFLSWIESAG